MGHGPKKEKPGGGNAGSDPFFLSEFTVSVCGLAGLMALASAERGYCYCPAVIFLFFFFLVLLLTSSNLTEAFADSHRFLSFCALTCPWVGRPISSKTRATAQKVIKNNYLNGALGSVS
jgi:hypothetical protein